MKNDESVLILSNKDFDKLLDLLEAEPDPERLAKLRKLLAVRCPWDTTLSDGLDEWEWEDDK